jgi:hypothetical protein
MTLRCALTMNTNAFQAGQSPVPQAFLGVANDSAAAVNVTAVDLYFTDLNGVAQRPCAVAPVVPIGFGQATVVPAAAAGVQGSITIGPMGIAIGSAAAGNQFAAVPPSAAPSNSQGSQPQQQQLFLRARVYGSDGSVTEASPAEFFVSYTLPPPLGYQGGFANFAGVNNSCLLAAVL